ncbi:MAG: sugar porter family MFS transporter [Thermoguttaceae bacterium]
MKTNSLVIRSAIIAALGGLLFGFDTAVISGTTESLRQVFQLSDWTLGFAVSIALIGTILGAATVQIPANIIGRKYTLVIMAVLYFVSAIGSAFPWDLTSFLFFRFIGGIAVGGSSVVSPLYTAEISPAKSRGVLVAITQFNIVFGILAAFFSNYIIAASVSNSDAWRVMFGVEAVPAAVFFFLLFITPESPRWLLTKGREKDAKSILLRLGYDENNVEDEVKTIQNAIQEENASGHEVFFSKRLRFPIFLAICIAAFNQLSGINAILYYAPSVFTMAGASKTMSMFFPVIIGFTNLIFTIAAMFVIDSFGRKKLMLAGSIGYILSLGTVALAFFVYSNEFNLSIKNIARTEAAAGVEEATKELNAAPENEITFYQEQLDVAKQKQEKAEKEAQEAAAKLSKAKPESSDEIKSGAVTEAAVPLTGVFVVLGGLMLFIASHAFGQGACIWVFIGEIFPNRVRAQGQALGSFTHWILCAVISLLFPPMVAAFGPGQIFLFFCGMMALQLIWVITVMPETKQVPLEEMQKKLGI